MREDNWRVYWVDPCPAPRQVRSDTWAPRPPVQRYRMFKDHLRAVNFELPDCFEIEFFLPMPPSWSVKKQRDMEGKPHRSRPDLDNLIKAVADATFNEDSHLWQYRALKRWGKRGSIRVRPLAGGSQ